MHDEVAVGVDIAVVVVSSFEGGVDLRVVELVQPVEQPAVGVRVRSYGHAQLGVAVRQLAQRFSISRRVLGGRQRIIEMQLFSHRNSRLHGHEVVTRYRDQW